LLRSGKGNEEEVVMRKKREDKESFSIY